MRHLQRRSENEDSAVGAAAATRDDRGVTAIMYSCGPRTRVSRCTQPGCGREPDDLGRGGGRDGRRRVRWLHCHDDGPRPPEHVAADRHGDHPIGVDREPAINDDQAETAPNAVVHSETGVLDHEFPLHATAAQCAGPAACEPADLQPVDVKRAPGRLHTTDVIVHTGVPGAMVTATAHYKTTDTTHSGIAASTGVADTAFRISRATPGYTVTVDVTVTAQGASKSCSTAFTRNETPGSEHDRGAGDRGRRRCDWHVDGTRTHPTRAHRKGAHGKGAHKPRTSPLLRRAPAWTGRYLRVRGRPGSPNLAQVIGPSV